MKRRKIVRRGVEKGKRKEKSLDLSVGLFEGGECSAYMHTRPSTDKENAYKTLTTSKNDWDKHIEGVS